MLLRLDSVRGTILALLDLTVGMVRLSVARRIALGAFGVVWEAGLSHKTSSAPPQTWNGRAFSSLTAERWLTIWS